MIADINKYRRERKNKKEEIKDTENNMDIGEENEDKKNRKIKMRNKFKFINGINEINYKDAIGYFHLILFY